MSKRMTKDRLVALMSVAVYGLDEIHATQHDWEHYSAGECSECRDALMALHWLNDLYYNRYIKPTEGQQ